MGSIFVQLRRFVFVALVFFAACSKEETKHPFSYDLHLSKKEGHNRSKALVCFHGMGGDHRIIHYVDGYFSNSSIHKPSLFSFNFPDHGLTVDSFDPEKTYLGTPQEIFPALYVLKQVVINEGFHEVTLYGFSAGGGAVINTLAMLNSAAYDDQLKEIGLTTKEKKKILAAIQKGKILLDAPLKSVEEVQSAHQKMHEIDVVCARYQQNEMEPIENLLKLKGLNLHFIVNFQNPDEVLSNRDDELYIERLKQVGHTTVIMEGKGHSLPHPHLWDFYLNSI